MTTIKHESLESWQSYTQRGAYGYKRMDTDPQPRLCRLCDQEIDPMEDYCAVHLAKFQGIDCQDCLTGLIEDEDYQCPACRARDEEI